MAHAQVVEVTPRDKILEAAEHLFARRGFAGVGLSEVAEAAGLSKSSLFHHFKSKVDLYAAVVGRILDHIDLRMTRALAAGGDPLTRIDRWLDTLVDFLGESPSHARLLLRSLFEDDDLTGTSEEEQHVDATTKRLLATAGDLLREGMAAGHLRAANIGHTLQSLIGLTIYHFASGQLGEDLLGRSQFTPIEIKRRKQEVKALLRHGLASGRAHSDHEED
ncbi:MAG: TetR/AcrR family transcriptional regulator [Deltaproteobacteria bacterium]|nr:TetR/AcrR family transcriptional regulator [Deltaproteobacteria bacterium]MBI3386877.1 TetR/AcrR family transcriptional regulator [Deltaproteobacteria bacterium]